MNRLVVVQCLPALHSGGVERSTLETARALVRRGHRSIIVSAGGRLQQQAEAEGSEHFHCDIGKKNFSVLAAIRQFRAFLDAVKPDIVHARSRMPAWACVLAMRNREPKPRFVTTVHGLNSPGWYSGVMLKGDAVVCVSDTTKKHVLAHWPKTDPEKIRVITPGIDPQEFPYGGEPDAQWRDNFLAEYPKLRGGKLLLLPARATSLKGHDRALELLAALRRDLPDVRLCCLGADEPGREQYLRELRQRAEQLGISDCVEFTAAVKGMANAYALSDLVLQLSVKPESFGRTVIEALSVGRPVLGWNLGGVGENLQKYFPEGIARPFDQTGLTIQAKRLLQDNIMPVRQALPNLSSMQSNMIELYEQLCA